MRPCVALFALVLSVGPALAQAKPITPEEAAKKVGKICTVEMEVKSAGKSRDGTIFFLNSTKDFRADDNFTIMLGRKAVEQLKAKEIADPAHFKGKSIRVTGKVSLYDTKPQIVVNDAKKVEIVGK